MAHSLPIDLPVMQAGSAESRTALVLHGGGGPRTVTPIVEHLASTMHAVAPTHPGWDGTPLPGAITSVAELAANYLAWLIERGERDVVLVGSSIGGWIALEMAVRAAGEEQYAGLIGGLVVVDAVGVEVKAEPIADFFSLDARALAEAAWHDPQRGYIDPGGLTDEQRANQSGNGRTMAAIAGRMMDSTLLQRLSAVSVPTLVAWGESDRIVTPAYGRAIAAAVPGAQFVKIPRAGHLPHLENPSETWAAIDQFLTAA